MADWSKIGSRGDVEDRRGRPLAFAGGGVGIVGVGIVLLLNLLTGGSVDLNSILNQLQATSIQSVDSKQFEGVDNYEVFTATVLGSTNDTWEQIFSKSNKTYEKPKLVLFRSATQSGCGFATSEVGPHYCPADKTIYIDETFYDELQTRFKAKGGDVAEAYVMAHEVGHHVQNQLGLFDESRSESNTESVRTELQADCFAGVWAFAVSHAGVFEPGEISEALDAAASVGDDRIQKAINGRVNPETWTHGSADQRVNWFNTGFDSGDPSTCDTSSVH